MSFPGITSGGTTDERRRAATVSALRHQQLPPQLLRLIASNGHVTRDCEGPEKGFFPQNDWKALKKVFKHNQRTAAIHHVIDQYDDAHEAWENTPGLLDPNRDRQSCWYKEVYVGGRLCIRIETEKYSYAEIMLNKDYKIIEIVFKTLDAKDIGDLSNLPPSLITLMIHNGDLTNFEFCKLPKGLKWLTHPGPEAESKLHVQSLPPGLDTLQLRSNWSRREYDPLQVHFNLPLPQGLKVCVPRMDGLVFHPEPAEMKESQAESTSEKIWELKWDSGSQIQVIME